MPRDIALIHVGTTHRHVIDNGGWLTGCLNLKLGQLGQLGPKVRKSCVG